MTAAKGEAAAMTAEQKVAVTFFGEAAHRIVAGVA
jgi:hypothetical protein